MKITFQYRENIKTDGNKPWNILEIRILIYLSAAVPRTQKGEVWFVA